MQTKEVMKIFKQMIFKILGSILLLVALVASAFAGNQDLTVLGYSDIPKTVIGDDFSVSQARLVQTLEYLKVHGYSFVSADKVLEKQALPGKAVLLTFDGAHRSFKEFVYPLLKMYQFPCVLAIAPDWINDQESESEKYMNWDEIIEVAKDELVEVALLVPDKKTDLSQTKNVLEDRAETSLRIVVWPYPQVNQEFVDQAESNQFLLRIVSSNRKENLTNKDQIDRFVIQNNASLSELIVVLDID